MEREKTVVQVAGWCDCNIFKYDFRKENKGEYEEDIVKVQTYKNYLKVLNDLIYLGLGNFSVEKALQKAGYAYVYRFDELVDANTLF
ncbi:MAG: DUF3310 domain-containing protein [Sulfurimonas sp.]|uniref:DUF3310 domain-containing protein n=1 Tax=Sulfurimonas sp. TaxID=2022749 RepID=UPI0028CDE085|nr:DUF3310 domain-containing protein [Sulfurimonas sp.]MDT8338560.1 DUF3310 domain-containing protein [Sulfurimonas sp.]